MIRVTITRKGGPFPCAFDGIHITLVSDGEVHEMPQDMAEVWLSRGWVVYGDLPAPPANIESKSEGPAPENKAEDGPAENKAKPRKGRGRK